MFMFMATFRWGGVGWANNFQSSAFFDSPSGTSRSNFNPFLLLCYICYDCWPIEHVNALVILRCRASYSNACSNVMSNLFLLLCYEHKNILTEFNTHSDFQPVLASILWTYWWRYLLCCACHAKSILANPLQILALATVCESAARRTGLTHLRQGGNPCGHAAQNRIRI